MRAMRHEPTGTPRTTGRLRPLVTQSSIALKTSLLHLGPTALLTAALVGCGGAPIPAIQLAETRLAVRAAEAAGARDTPGAAVHLGLAEHQLQAATALIDDDEYVEAARTLARAEVDAELALERAKAATQYRNARSAQMRVESLKAKTP